MDFITKSGAEITINAAPWKDAKALKKAIERNINGKGISFDADMSTIIDIVLRADSSDDVDEALARCLIRCLRNGQKIVEDTFNDTDARKDYYEIIVACLKENLGPLVEGLFAQLSVFQKPLTNAPKAQE